MPDSGRPSLVRAVADRPTDTARTDSDGLLLRAVPLLCTQEGAESIGSPRHSLQVETLTVSLTDLWTNLFKPAFDICYNTVMLYQTLGMSGVSYTSGYMLVAFGLMRFIVPNFRALTRKQFDLESRFRAVHNRLVDHTESIAFFGGDDVEKRIVDERFEVPPSR